MRRIANHSIIKVNNLNKEILNINCKILFLKEKTKQKNLIKGMKSNNSLKKNYKK